MKQGARREGGGRTLRASNRWFPRAINPRKAAGTSRRSPHHASVVPVGTSKGLGCWRAAWGGGGR